MIVVFLMVCGYVIVLAILAVLASFLPPKFKKLPLGMAALALVASAAFSLFIGLPADWLDCLFAVGPFVLSGFALFRSIRRLR